MSGDVPEIAFVSDMPGLPGMSRCALVRLDEVGALYRLQSLLDPDLRLLVATPPAFFADYAPQIDDATAASIGLESAEDALVLVVVTTGGSVGEATANLLAPIVVNARTRQAVQVLQLEDDLPLAAPLIPA
jgi:flagellar assembly factor FliW